MQTNMRDSCTLHTVAQKKSNFYFITIKVRFYEDKQQIYNLIRHEHYP